MGCCNKVKRGVVGATKAILRIHRADPDTIQKRRSLCEQCAQARSILGVLQCSLCSCIIGLKVANRDESCPAAKWLETDMNQAFLTPQGTPLPLHNLYANQSAFLICGGPSFAQQDASLLNQPGIMTMGVNNSPRTFRPNLWCSVDDPGNFIRSIWFDPRILKFVHEGAAAKRVFDSDAWKFTDRTVASCSGVVYYRRNDKFDPLHFMTSATLNWGNSKERGGGRSVMLVAIRILYELGFRHIYLLGVDFKMDKETGYHFKQGRSAGSIRGNNKTYELLKERFTQLLPLFQTAKLNIYNCNPESGLKVFPFVDYATAVKDCIQRFGLDAAALASERTEGLYDRAAAERKKSKERKVEKKQEDGSWASIRFKRLRVGDIFRMFEPDKTPVTDLGTTEWRVLTKPYKQAGSWHCTKKRADAPWP